MHWRRVNSLKTSPGHDAAGTKHGQFVVESKCTVPLKLNC